MISLKNADEKIEILENMLKKHTDLKSRELYVRQQEKQAKETLIYAAQQLDKIEFYENFIKIINKSNLLKDEFKKFLFLLKMSCDENEIIQMEQFFKRFGEDYVGK
jgi:hypothetical protein